MKINYRRSCAWSVFSTIILLVVSGCSFESKFADRDPQVSDLVINGEVMPEVNQISVPMPTVMRPARKERADAASLWQSGTRNLFLDQRAEAVGDILTIVIDIDDRAQLKNESEQNRSGSEKTNKPVFLGYGSQIAQILPGIGDSDLPTGSQIIDLGSTSSNSGDGLIKRNESIKLKVAAMIIQQLPNGNFVIAGRQEVKVNSELRELRIAGIIRPEDIHSTNTITYDKIAEARITYGGRGQITQVMKPRSGMEILNIILPY
jgi:flagellar L-ring protein precursor FlgH